MNRRIGSRGLLGVLGAAVLAVGTVAAAVAPASADAHAGANAGKTTMTTKTSKTSNVTDVCGAAKPGFDRCFAQARTDVQEPAHISRAAGTAGRAAAAATAPAGYSPADLHAAYNLPTTGGANQTVAIVDAGDDSAAEADLAVYRSAYGLPACTTANGCFTKVNQSGAATPVPADRGWGVEIALDLDMVSAACPQCKILLVEADTATPADLGASVDTAVRLGATEVSNSYGATESSATPGDAAFYTHPGVAIVASSGDSGYGIPSEPAVFGSVVAVGGTSLAKAATARGWTETAWNSGGGAAGSGCSAWVAKPAWQTDANCPGRMIADVSADADPQTGPAVYVTDTLGTPLRPGWNIIGGTSASSPFIAGVIALAGNPAKYGDASAFYAPAARAGLNDVIGGTNATGLDCGGDYQCTAVAGYDGPTGMGSPNGLSAF